MLRAGKIARYTYVGSSQITLYLCFVFFLYVLDILRTVDQNVDPCDDFFLHACGGWLKNNPIPPNEPLWNQVLILKTKNDQLLKTLLSDEKFRELYVTVS